MRPVLQAVAGMLERAQVVDPDAVVEGYLGDQRITFEMKMKTEGSMTLRWTEVSVPVHEGLSLLLSIRPSTPREKREIERGLARSCSLGDPLFDAAFVVEAAPERLVGELIDAAIRRDLLALRPDHLRTSESALTVQMPDWVEDEARAALLVRVSARLGATAAEIARRQQADVGSLEISGFRGEIPRGARARDAMEIQQLALALETKEAARKREAIHLALIILGALGILGAVLTFFLAR